MKIANEVAVLVMKGITMGQRTKPKDFYDLYMLVKYFKSGPRSMAGSLRPLLGNKLVGEAVANIRRYFERFDSLGPSRLLNSSSHPTQRPGLLFSEMRLSSCKRCLTR
jgi:hypothetical protein